MNTIKLDLTHGSVFFDSEIIAVNEKGILAKSIAKLCSTPTQTDEGRTQYRSSRKAIFCGQSCDVVIEIGEGRLYAVAFLFDLIEFFESSILESKVLKACEKSLNVKFMSDHPSAAFLDPFNWGQVVFSYDPKQGDLSLDIIFEHSPNQSS
ncbi:hypothetical protein [Massilia sp.]|uniref:hypothetical protein n=1 Tax=Massilia sp. TaxID=1882437 RepID=UPI00289C5337|nr:hypothetical protein [Massilia sp.]